MNEATPHFGVCIKNEGCDDLHLRKLYQFLPDEIAEKSGLTRAIDDSGEDYLYPAENFIPLSLPSRVEQALAAISTGVGAK
jgi:hypothetical protein